MQTEPGHPDTHPTRPVPDRPGAVDGTGTVDLNADLGESFGAWSLGDDEAMLALVTSANVACGFHAGDPLTIRRTCAAAARAGVSVGAHVGYRDLVGFGRRFLDVAPDELTTDVVYQIGALTALARSAGTTVRYVKPHGALYNAVVDHPEQARAVVAAVLAVDPALPLLTLPGSVVAREARAAGLRVVTEAFVDRAYTREGTLASRRLPGAVLDDPQAVAARAVRMAVDGTVETIDGAVVQVAATSLCVHGDTPGAVAMAAAVRQALARAGVHVAAFT